MWFAEALAERGHVVVAAGRSERLNCSSLRAERLSRVTACCQPFWSAPFGSSSFLDIVERNGPFDVLCHHGAETAGYRSKEFDWSAAVAANARSLQQVLGAVRAAGGRRIVLTGSVFEAGEGAGTLPLRAFSAYGLSKTLTSQIFSYHAEQEEFALGKFVIPNPFGPYEEPRFTDYLIRTWCEGKTALVGTPHYVRDNIHVSLLAEFYCGFVQSLPETGFCKINPSGYAESQSAFAARFAREIGGRLKIETPLEEATQQTQDQPLVRVNTDVMTDATREWDEGAAWDQLAEYYARRYEIGRS